MARSFRPVKSPLYQQLVEHLRPEVAALPPGTQLEPEQQMAKRFSVSVITVREALRILASEQWIERHPGRGTFILPRPEPTAAQGRHVAFLIDEDVSHPQSSPVYLKIAQHLREQLAARGISSRLYVGNNPPGHPKPDLNSPEFLADLQGGKILAVAAILAQPSPVWLEEVERQRLPVVVFGNRFALSTIVEPVYLPDAITLLREAGCRRIAFIGWFGHKTDLSPHVNDLLSQLEAQGMETRPEWIRYDGNPCTVGSGWEEFREVWLAHPEKPDGLIVSDDLLFKGVIPAISKLRIDVPGELHIVTRSNQGVSALAPFPVSRLEIVPQEIALSLEEQLLTLLEGRTPEETLRRIPYHLRPENAATPLITH